MYRFVLTCLFALNTLAPAAPAFAQGDALRRNDWSTAEMQAARLSIPLAIKLVRFYRFQMQDAANAEEIDAFRRANPTWPMQHLLTRRWEEALAKVVDDGTVIRAFGSQTPVTDQGRLRLADALARTNARGTDAAIRTAWIENGFDAAGERAFLDRYAVRLTADDHWRRFERLAFTGGGPALAQATTQATRLSTERTAMAQTWIALRRDAANAPALRAALPASQRNHPGLVLEHARWLRRAEQDARAAQLWQTQGTAAQEAAPAALASLFWNERHLLTRRLLRMNDNQAAYAVVVGHGLADGEAAMEGEFLAGWIALRRLNQPAVAERHFKKLSEASRAVVTQARAFYWLGRTAAARGDTRAASGYYQQASAFPTTYYGQLALLALGQDDAALAARIRAERDPAPDASHVAAFNANELTHAAGLLIGWGEARRARAFLLQMEDQARTPGDRTMIAQYATRLGRPDLAVWIARRSGIDGVVLPQTGWPMPYAVPGNSIEPAMALAIMRQESNFESDVISPAGARGLMQLMPGTARTVARRLGERTSLAALTDDTGHNMRLGTTYLRQMLDQADGCAPCAFAAYNAGPHRLREWLGTNGDPRLPDSGVSMIDWIELIPFNETRNYVQRVVENMVVYRALRNETTPHPLSAWLRQP